MPGKNQPRPGKTQQKRSAKPLPTPDASGRETLFLIASVFTVTMLTLAAYWPAHTFSFLNFDDLTHIIQNPNIQSGFTWDSITWAFSSRSVTDVTPMWHPLTWLSFMLDHILFGLNPAAYHVENVILHILNSILIFAIFHKMTRAFWPCVAAALLFALHPLHVESVAWITERKDVLSTLLGLLSLYAFLFYVGEKKVLVYSASILLFTLSLLAKPMMVTLPFVLLLLDVWPLNRFRIVQIKVLVIEKIPFFLVSLAFSVLAYASQGSTLATNVAPLGIGQRIANTIQHTALFFRKFLFPHDLSVLYPLQSEINPFLVFVAFVLLAGVTAGVILLRKNHPFMLVGWLIYLGMLFPVAGIVQIGNQSCADRYTYMPMTGLIIMLCWGLYGLLQNLQQKEIISPRARNAVFLSIFAVIALVFAGVTNIYAGFWKDNETLMQRAIRVNPDNAMAHWYLGRHYLANGDLDKSIECTKETLRSNPDLTLYGYLGMQLFDHRKYEEALKYFHEGYRRTPGDPVIVNGIGLAYLNTGKPDKAVKYFRQALQLSPSDSRIRENLELAAGMAGESKAWGEQGN